MALVSCLAICVGSFANCVETVLKAVVDADLNCEVRFLPHVVAVFIGWWQ